MLTSRPFLFFSRYLYFGLLVLCSVGLLGGCNVFGSGSLDEGDSVDELVADADVAMTKGNYDAAVESLEKAYDEEPDNPEVRIKLSTALYGQQGITVVDLKRVVDYISGLEEDQAKSQSLRKNSYQCSVESAEPNPSDGPYTEIDLERTTTFGPFTNPDHQKVIKRVGSSILVSDFDETDEFEKLPPNLKGSWFTISAFTDISSAILSVYKSAQNRGGKLFRDPDGGVVFCAPTELDLENLECEAYRAAENEDLIGGESLLAAALEKLRAKREALGADEGGLIPDALDELITAVTNNIDQATRESCTASSTNTFAGR